MKKKLKLLIDMLKKRPHLAFAYLFGSRTSGATNKNSDWDVAVFFSEPPEKVSRWLAFELEAELSRGMGETVQVVVLNSDLSPVFGFEILKHGLLLLDRDENLRINFENRILRQYYDWQYFLNRQMKAEKGLSRA
ncbi:MAG: nucleotidyltransferase domain-containing protein [Syntrophaceae bacterium]|nr:nucleotidyltransferase domain-containing protein [Syntrophaceae bacterium]